MASRGARALLAAFLVIQSAALSSQSDSQGPPHAFPREGASKVLDNAWVTAWDATWTPNKPTLLHRHLYDYFGVELTDSRTSAIEPGGESRVLSLKRGRSWFVAKGVTHVEIGLTDNPPRRAILVDLKDTSSPFYENTTVYPTALPATAVTPVFENQRIVMWDYTWTPGQAAPMYFYDKNTVIMFVDGGELTVTTPDGRPQVLPVTSGKVLFKAGGSARSEQATKGVVRAIVVGLK